VRFGLSQDAGPPSIGVDVSALLPESVGGVVMPPSSGVIGPLVTEQPAKAMLPAATELMANKVIADHLALNDMNLLQLRALLEEPVQVHNPHTDLQLVSVQLESSSALVLPDACDFPHASTQSALAQP
jgi:hypothetical protein